ncbi:MAG: DM13 domain-containing protein [Acidimicrobiia bacterium]
MIRSFISRHPLLTALAVVVGLVGAAAAWYLFSPLFISKTVIEEFPRAAMAAEIPDGMTAEEVEEAMLDAEGDSSEATEDMPGGVPIALATGAFRDADDFHMGSGTATIYQLEDGSRVLRLENLDVTNGPDLHVILSPVAEPQTREDVSASGYVDLGGLKGNIGDQNYEIPTDVDVAQQMSVVIYCKPFHVIFSIAPLQASA